MKTQSRALWAVFAVFLLAIPVAAALVARADKDAALPTLGTLPAFALSDQEGKAFDRSALDGKVWIADFIFTRCAEICPRLTSEMAKLRPLTKQASGTPIRLLSISVDPDRDTPDALARYSQAFGAEPATWRFVTGTSKTIEETVIRGFKVAVEKSPNSNVEGGFDILHGMNFVLVDAAGTIRGYYDAQTPAEVERLRKDATALAARGGK